MLTKKLSLFAVSLLGAFFYLTSSSLFLAKKNVYDGKYKVALIFSDDVFYHRKAAQGFLDTFKLDEQLALTCEINQYEMDTLDPLLATQAIQKAFEDCPDIVICIGGMLSKLVRGFSDNLESKIPSLFIGVSQPVEMGLVSSLSQSNNNMTGVGTVAEQSMLPFQLLFLAQPDIKSILIPYDANDSTSSCSVKSIQSYFADRQVVVTPLPIVSMSNSFVMVQNFLERHDVFQLQQYLVSHLPDSLVSLEAIRSTVSQVESLLINHDALIYLEGDMVGAAYCSFVRLCRRHGKFLFALDLEAIEEGAPMAYGVDPLIPGATAVEYVKQILFHKKKPSDLPVTLLHNIRKFESNSALLKKHQLGPLLSGSSTALDNRNSFSIASL